MITMQRYNKFLYLQIFFNFFYTFFSFWAIIPIISANFIFVAVIKKKSNMKTTKESKIDRFIKVSEFVGIAMICAFMALGVLF